MTCEGVIEFKSDYSAMSGPTTTLVLGGADGRTEQVLRLGFRFSSSESAIYSKWECPPFVSACFDPEQSTSFSQPMAEKTTADVLGERTGYTVHDVLKTPEGSIVSEKFNFHFITSNNPFNILFRDVSGYIGMGKDSSIFNGRRLRIREDAATYSNEVSISVVSGVVPLPEVVVASPHPERWSFIVSRLSLASHMFLVDVEVIFDPLAQDFVFPSSLRDALVAAITRRSISEIEFDGNGRLWFPCQMDSHLPYHFVFQLSIQLGEAETFVIPIEPQLLEFPRESVEARISTASGQSRNVCPTRIRICDEMSDSRIMLGRQLLRSVEFVELDFAARTIGFSKSKYDERTFQFPLSEISLPGFYEPMTHPPVSRIDFHPTGAPDALFLVSVNHHPLDAYPDLHCWQFIRNTCKTAEPSYSVRAIEGTFSDVNLGNARDIHGISVFMGTREAADNEEATAPSLKVSIVYPSTRKVMVCVKTTDENHSFFEQTSRRSSQSSHDSFPSSLKTSREKKPVKVPSCWTRFCAWIRGSKVHVDTLEQT